MNSKPFAHDAMVEEWRAEGEVQSRRIERLVELAQVACERLPHMSLIEKKRVLDLLDVRVQVLDAGSRTTRASVRTEGVFFDLASIFGPRNGDAPPTCMEPQRHSRGRNHQTPGVM